MKHYTNIKMRISEGQKDKIKKACESNSKSITIRFKCSDLYGEDVVALTNSQLDRLVKAYEEKKGITIRMSKTQLPHIIAFLTFLLLCLSLAHIMELYQDWRVAGYKN